MAQIQKPVIFPNLVEKFVTLLSTTCLFSQAQDPAVGSSYSI